MQQIIRNKLNKIIELHGLKYVFFCRKLGISRSTMSRFKNSELDLSAKHIEKLTELLNAY